MEHKYNPKLIPTARALRKNMTKEERRLWYEFLRGFSVKFVRQKPLGKYIADFYCAKAKLVIELDGSQHFEENGLAHDSERTAFLEQYGIMVIRIPNNEITFNLPGVCEYIERITLQRVDPEADGQR